MSTEAHTAQERIAPEQDLVDADQEEIVDVLGDLVEEITDLRETIEDQQETIEDQQEEIDDLREELHQERERRAKADAEQRQRITDAEERLDDVEEADSDDASPTPEASESANRMPLTPIERLSEGESDDVAQHVTPSIERALTLFENLPKWGTSTPKGITLRPADKPKDLLEAARDESLAWQQYYRAAEALESLSKGAVTFFDHDRHGKMICFHAESELHERQTAAKTGHSQPSLARGD